MNPTAETNNQERITTRTLQQTGPPEPKLTYAISVAELTQRMIIENNLTELVPKQKASRPISERYQGDDNQSPLLKADAPYRVHPYYDTPTDVPSGKSVGGTEQLERFTKMSAGLADHYVLGKHVPAVIEALINSSKQLLGPDHGTVHTEIKNYYATVSPAMLGQIEARTGPLDSFQLHLLSSGQPVTAGKVDVLLNNGNGEVNMTIKERPKAIYPAEILDRVQQTFGILLGKENSDKLLTGKMTGLLLDNEMRPGKLYVKTDAANQPAVAFVTRQETLTIPRTFLGHPFSDLQRQNLETTAHAGARITLQGRDKPFQAYVSVDRDLNRLTFIPVSKIRIPDKIKGVELNPEQKEDLREGRKTFVNGMTSTAGRTFSGYIQVSAAEKSIAFLFRAKPEITQVTKSRATGGPINTSQPAVTAPTAGKPLTPSKNHLQLRSIDPALVPERGQKQAVKQIQSKKQKGPGR